MHLLMSETAQESRIGSRVMKRLTFNLEMNLSPGSTVVALLLILLRTSSQKRVPNFLPFKSRLGVFERTLKRDELIS